MHFGSGYVPLSLLMCLLRGLVLYKTSLNKTDTSTTKGAHNLIQMHATI